MYLTIEEEHELKELSTSIVYDQHTLTQCNDNMDMGITIRDGLINQLEVIESSDTINDNQDALNIAIESLKLTNRLIGLEYKEVSLESNNVINNIKDTYVKNVIS